MTAIQLDDLARLIAGAIGARGVHFEERVQSLWSGYGAIWRVRCEGGPDDSLIVKWVDPPPGSSDRSHRRKLRSYEVERAFYTRYAAKCGSGCRVARPLHIEAREGRWLFLFEDLDAAGFQERPVRPSADQVVRCLRWLARLHATFLGRTPEGLWSRGTYWHLATRPDELARLDHAKLRAAAPRFDSLLAGARFHTFVHGDAKLENFCFSREDVAAVDFQYVGGGVGVQDVAYFLGSSVPPTRWADAAPRHLDTYFRELRAVVAEQRPETDVEALEREWRNLYPVAWADFYRFLLGWAPAEPRDAYSERMLKEALAGR